MRRLALLAILSLGLAVLAGCSQPAPSHDKAYYAANAPERARQMAECQNDPGRLAATPNCINAQSADADAHAQHFYDVQKPASRVADPGKL